MIVWLAAGVVLSTILWRLLQPVFANPVLQRTNLKGHQVATAGGLVIVVTVLLIAGFARMFTASVHVPLSVFHATVLVLGFGVLGVFDDLAGDNAKGFRGHLGALLHGQLTSGGVKLLGGVAVAALAVGSSERSVLTKLGAVAVVAGCANLGNLFDRAPGRTIKVATLAAVGFLGGGYRAGLALVLGAALGMFVPDMRAKVMLGDTGANVLGAVVGYAIAESTGGGLGLAVAFAVVVALNLASERVSFSRVIAAVPPLRWLDELGRDA